MITPSGEVGVTRLRVNRSLRTDGGCGWLVVAGMPTGAAAPAHVR
jgi:hypothetical protein